MMARHLRETHFRTFAPFDREHPIFELVEGEDNVLFEMAAKEDGVVEVGFHESSPLFRYDELLKLLHEGHELVQQEMKESRANNPPDDAS
jgi:hypothetical protein